ncbi:MULTISPECIES: L-glutamate gamma-semialdehyde dehydrogenase [Pseudothermotoga]|jgi:1-pyrroline-5-carboxylate dehydrogenase|uniref:L-glutamate gamma-semialdehyde dehydrogenase n=1 Tax=Pseudothermotoga TaxID=1643951 RepID=UPI00041FD510|nr:MULTISPECIES: L-glutamate gamma-semialdehyde dehydrogenase [Pseudothermotoga]MDI3495679.1 1-pyrroline-5-carboxylate dehydrogenase [Pseudothermotoga sp.]MDK2884630.1 1-pyrroline-5-carboxylate dehydrogenase [Pseudothermotoga sp.]
MKWIISKPVSEMRNIITYSEGSKEREQLVREINAIKTQTIDIPVVIGGEEIFTDDVVEIRSPHDHNLVLARAHLAGERELKKAIEVSLDSHEQWAELDWYHRVSIFMKAAELLSGPERFKTIAAIMMNHSKNPFEAEIDLIELCDFYRFNAYYANFIYEQQPDQETGELNRLDYRPLEGFVCAITPFNFFSIAGNLPSSPAMMGNTVIWKPATSTIFSNYYIVRVLEKAGLPEGIINFVPFRSKNAHILLKNSNLAGIHFTGSYETFIDIWKTVGENIVNYKNFPKLVGETGGKDFIFVHKSAEIEEVGTSIIRGAFESQGQKCSAVSRVYVPESFWPDLRNFLVEKLGKIKYGPVDDFENFMGAVIDQSAYKRAVLYIEYAREHQDEYEFIYGGNFDDSKGWFIQPTVIKTSNPRGKLMVEEIFAPIVTVYVYSDDDYEETLKLCENSTPFGLTGAIFSKDRYAIALAEKILRYAAGNFYINDKPTGAIVSRQPFGGARASGTNDKAGSWINLLRWITPRTIKENLKQIKMP